MRVASRLSFGERNTGGRKKRNRYFLAFEGKKTETLYFSNLIRTLQRDSTSAPLIEVIVFAREEDEEGQSNPLQVFKKTLQSVQEGSFSLNLSFHEVFDQYLSSMIEGPLDKKLRILAFQNAQKHLSSENVLISSKVTQETLGPFLTSIHEYCTQSLTTVEGLKTVKEIMEEYNREDLEYDRETDKVCIIVDRDQHSFTSDQYDAVVNGCKKEEFLFYVSNPCFEFFLLLHKTDCKQFSSEKLRLNLKRGHCTYVEKLLGKYVTGFKKSKLRFLDFAEDIPKALSNCELYAQEISELKLAIGTNVHVLIKEFLTISEV